MTDFRIADTFTDNVARLTDFARCSVRSVHSGRRSRGPQQVSTGCRGIIDQIAGLLCRGPVRFVQQDAPMRSPARTHIRPANLTASLHP